jgi:hypothetical protein
MAALVIISLVVLAMSVGVIVGHGVIQGSCGGGKIGDEAITCDFCEHREQCRRT